MKMTDKNVHPTIPSLTLSCASVGALGFQFWLAIKSHNAQKFTFKFENLFNLKFQANLLTDFLSNKQQAGKPLVDRL